MHIRNLAILTIGSAALSLTAMAQQDAYQGVSRPPNDPITTTQEAPPPQIAKPSPSVVAETPAPQQPMPSSVGPADPDAGYVGQGSSSQGYVARDGGQPAQPALSSRSASPYAADPDGDIVHPRSARPGELLEGVTIRVKLLDRLSSRESEKGEEFRGQVAYDVLQDGKVLIPAGSGIEGRVTAVSGGHFGGHGSLHLRPDVVILPDGSRYTLHAETTGTVGSHTRVGGEGAINPGSRAKKDGVEYGAVVGTGLVTGAVLGGPVGALTGGLIGAGVVTTHLMVDHPQTTLEPGSILLFSLTEPMNLMPAGS